MQISDVAEKCSSQLLPVKFCKARNSHVSWPRALGEGMEEKAVNYESDSIDEELHRSE